MGIFYFMLQCTQNNTKGLDMSSTMTIRLDDTIKNRLDRLAQATHRTKSFLAAEAIQKYLEVNEWQIQEISAALQEADAGDFASKEEVNSVFDKWTQNGN